MARPNYICRHKRKQYSPLEFRFKKLIKSNKELKELWDELEFIHEWLVCGKDAKEGDLSKFRYWLDFYSVKKGVDLEIHHNGHKKGRWYMPLVGEDVFSRDKLRTKRLDEKGIKTVAIFEKRLTKGWIRNYLLKIKDLPDFPTLDKWI